MELLVVLGVLWLAYSNGANDNFKGVATLYSSGTPFRRALLWATTATVAGSLVSIVLAEQLLKTFSGAGLIPDHLLAQATTPLVVAAAAGFTVFLATILGMPTSTTHALAGSLLGVAWVSSTSGVPLAGFIDRFGVPLLVSPLISIALTIAIYKIFRWSRADVLVNRNSCVCLEQADLDVAACTDGTAALDLSRFPRTRTGTVSDCSTAPNDAIPILTATSAATAAHYVSSAAVCFGRSVNDTPKIAALLLALGAFDPKFALVAVASAVAIGGLVHSRRIAETMSNRLTEIDEGQGLCANIATSVLVLFASRWGVPVSTTHVSCGSIFGIGLLRRQTQWSTLSLIAVTWLTTFPLAAIASAMLFWTIG